MKFLLPEGWKQPKGYSQAVMAEGKQIYISGQIGWDETATFQTDDFAEQAGQANIFRFRLVCYVRSHTFFETFNSFSNITHQTGDFASSKKKNN